MTTIRIDFSELLAGAQRFEGLPELLEHRLASATARAAEEGAREIRRLAPKAFSTLTLSVQASQIGLLEWRAGPNVAYARYVEDGRRPGAIPPPHSAIADWIRVRGIVARDCLQDELPGVIARSIGRRGIEPRPFVRPAAPFVQRRLNELGRAAIAQALAEVGDGS